MAGRPYTPDAQSGELAAFTQTHPFHKCLHCNWDLPSSAGPLCSRCELADDHSQVSKRPNDPPTPDRDSDGVYNI